MRAGVHIDFETHSVLDLNKVGIHRYIEHPSTDVWFFWYQVNAGPRRRWKPGDPPPSELLTAIANGERVVGHNSIFEFYIWNFILLPKHCPNWPRIQRNQISCTMIRAMAMGYPAKLESVSDIMALKNRKDMEGHAIMKKYAKPRRIDRGVPVWQPEHGPEWDHFSFRYGSQDVAVESEMDELLPELPQHDYNMWVLDTTVNARGIRVDVEAAANAIEVVDIAKRRANARLKEITNGAITAATQTAAIIEWLQGRGFDIESIKKSADTDDFLSFLTCTGDAIAMEVMDIRKNANKTSLKKFQTMLDCVCEDGRIRDQYQFKGASRTGRDAGRLVQPTNLHRVDLKEKHNVAATNYVLTVLRSNMKHRDMLDMLQVGLANPLVWLAKSMRLFLLADKGKLLTGGDFKNIEGRMNAWLANEAWKLQAFIDADAKRGEDLYKLTYAKMFGVDASTVGEGEDRQQGKVAELACGYQGGVGAYLKFGETYNLKIAKIVEPVIRAAGDTINWQVAELKYPKATDKFDLTFREWVACKTLVRNWRAANKRITQSWWDLGTAAVAAIDMPGRIIPVYDGKCAYLYDAQSGWLYARLPGGGIIHYANAHIKEVIQVIVNDKGEEYEKVRRTVIFWSESQQKQWRPRALYGGLQCENFVQSSARELFEFIWMLVEAHGLQVIFRSYDELVTEQEGEHEDLLKRLMQTVPPEYKGLPLAASVWSGERYGK